MSFITLRQVGVLTPEPLFQNLTLTVPEACRIGVVAQNGGGKTTLLRCIAGIIDPTEGMITCSRGLRLGLVEQDVPCALLDQTFFECLRLALPVDEGGDVWRIEVLLALFEVPDQLHHLPLRALSGGWQKIALIARAFVSEPDALLLDEPTNHLDLSKIQFLERWLSQNARNMSMVIVSHDRKFLEACTTYTLFLRPETSKFYAHPYHMARQLLAQEDAAEKTKLEQNMKEAQRLRRSANELKNIGINSRSDAAQKKSKQIYERALEVENTLTKPHKERSGKIELCSQTIHSRVLLSMDDLTVSTPGGKELFKTGKVKVFRGDRIVLLGDNGAGKSLLLNLIRKAYTDPLNAKGLQFSPTVVMGYVDQQMSQLPGCETPFNIITNRFRLGDQRTRTLLAGAGFPVDRQNARIEVFSLGQRARLGMLVLRLTEPNFYVLDEPTNHMDILGQEKLEKEILEQESTCLLVSHDRSFVNAIGTRYFEIVKGQLKEIISVKEEESL